MRRLIAESGRELVARCSELPKNNRNKAGRKTVFRLAAFVSASAAAMISAPVGTQDAIANGDTRSLSFFHTHTRESTTVTFRRNGEYDQAALQQLNWFLRDWRNDKPTKMDPRLFDILWEVHRESGSRQPIHIISSYRSPETNSALRRRSSGVAENSQHMLGKAMDVRLPDVDSGRLRAIAMKMQYGGVGYYQSSDFVHVDTGGVRAWPRMSQEQLARLFPDGKTLHLPANGKPLPGYEQAKAEILARNTALATQASSSGGSLGSLMAGLFGRKQPEPQAQSPEPKPTVLAYASPDYVEPIRLPPPLPPQRPSELSTPAEPDAPPVSDSRETAVLPVQSPAPAPKPVLGFDEKAAIQAMFEPRTNFLDLGFSSHMADELSTTRFSGPAVKPVPVLKQVQAKLEATSPTRSE